MKSTRLKFKVTQRTEYEESTSVTMDAVFQGSQENEQFWKYTPSGQLTFSTCNKQAVAEMSPGSEFYIDLTLSADE